MDFQEKKIPDDLIKQPERNFYCQTEICIGLT